QIVIKANPDVAVDCGTNQTLPYELLWPFGTPSQFIEITPRPATQVRWKIIDPLIGPVFGLSRMTYEWSEFLENGRAVVQVNWDGLLEQHSVEVRVDWQGGFVVLQGGIHELQFDIDLRCRQQGPVMNIDLYVDGGFMDEVSFIGEYHQCNNRLLFFVSNFDVPHMSKVEITTIQ
ncbi:unnamed protein product, partial [marine sediment metagenome]